MFRREKLIAAMAAAALLSVRCAFGATIVSPLSGTVLVNQGKGFVQISGEVEVGPGTKVMVRPGGSAMVYYGNNCSGEIGPGQIWVVKENVDCDKPTGAVGPGGLGPGGTYVTGAEMSLGVAGMTVASGAAIASAVGNSGSTFTPLDPISP